MVVIIFFLCDPFFRVQHNGINGMKQLLDLTSKFRGNASVYQQFSIESVNIQFLAITVNIEGVFPVLFIIIAPPLPCCFQFSLVYCSALNNL